MNTMPNQNSFSKKSERSGSRFPVIPFYAVLGLLAFAVSATVFGNYTGIGTVKDTFGKPVDIRDIVITTLPNDLIQVTDAHTKQIVQTFEAGQGGFVRGSIRPLTRVRAATDPANAEPYRLIRWQNGAISLSDTVTGQRYYLNAFGKDNAAAFAALLDADANKKTTAVQTASN